MPQLEREIFFRYNYYCQPVAQIAQEMALNPASVRTRLHRGRKKLKKTLTKGGYPIPVERNVKTAVSADRIRTAVLKKVCSMPSRFPLAGRLSRVGFIAAVMAAVLCVTAAAAAVKRSGFAFIGGRSDAEKSALLHGGRQRARQARRIRAPSG